MGVHPGEFAKRTLAALLVFEHAGGFLDQRPAVLRTRVEYLVESSLADDRVGVTTQAGVVEQLLDVHQSRG